MDREQAIAELRGHLEEYLELGYGLDTKKPFSCLNPQHEDKNPSMGFDAARNQVHCFSCGEKYDIIDLIQHDRNCDFNEALEIGCEMYHIQIDKEPRPSSGKTNSAPVKDNAAKQPQKKQEQEQDPAVRARLQAEFDAAQPATNEHPYLQMKRVRTDKTLKVNQAGELLIPLYDVDGLFRGYQRIAAAPTIDDKKIEKWSKQQAKGTAQTGAFHIIGGYQLTARDKIILCEGYATSFSVWECLEDRETTRVVFSLSSTNLPTVAGAIHSKYGLRPFIAADCDKAGRNAAEKCRDICSGHVLPPFNSPDDGTDWNDYFNKYGLNATRGALMRGLSHPEFLPVKKEEQPTSAEHELDINDFYIEFGDESNFEEPDIIGDLFQRGAISGLIAPPGTGKTWFVLYLTMYFSRGDAFDTCDLHSKFPIGKPYKSLILSAEGGYNELLKRSKLTDWGYNRQYLGVVDLNTVLKKNLELSLTQKEGRLNFERLIDKRQPDIVFLDSLMAFSDFDENRSQEMNKLMKYLMKIANSNDIAIVPVHHTRKRKLNERLAAQIMDEMVGSNMMQRYMRRIIGLQPKGQMIVDEVSGEEPVIVRDLKNNISRKFKPFTFCLATNENTGKLNMEFDLEPDLTFKAADKKSEILHYIEEHYKEGDDRFTRADLEQVFTAKSTLQKALKELVEAGKLGRCGESKSAEYFLRPEIVD